MKHLYFLAFLLLPFCLVAQTNYKPGYVVTLSGDTLRGSIDYKEWDNNPKSFSFKPATAAAQKFSTDNCSAFGVDKMDNYVRYIGKISIDRDNLQDLSSNLDTTFRTDTVFLRRLVAGNNLTLYKYTDNIKDRFYLQRSNEKQPYEIYRHLYLSPDEGARVVEINSYRSQLLQAAYFYGRNSTGFSSKIQQARYTESDIAPVVRAINASAAVKSVSKAGFAYFVGLGANLSTIHYKGATPYALANVTKNTSASPQLSAGLDLFPNATVRKLAIRLSANFYTTGFNLTASDTYAAYSRHFRQYILALSPQVMYNLYNSPTFKFYIAAGINANFSATGTNQYSVNTTSPVFTYIGNGDTALHNLWLSIPINAGVFFNKNLELYASYTRPAAVTSYAYFSGNVATYSAGLHYYLSSKTSKF